MTLTNCARGLPFVIDGLANTEDEMPYLFAAAARAAGALGPAAREAVPFLLRPLEGSIKDTFITFAKFGSHSAGGRDYTTCQIEALRALARMGEGAESAVPVIKQFLGRELPRYDDASRLQRAPNLGTEARTALAAIERQP
jgi:hypothetical protein